MKRGTLTRDVRLASVDLGGLPAPHAREMVRRMRHGCYAEVARAGHVVHYDQPAGWRSVVEPFVLEVLRA